MRQPTGAPAEAGAVRVRRDEGLSITVLGPRIHWLREFARFWFAEWRKRNDDPHLLAATKDFDVVETFRSEKLEIIPSLIEIVDPANAGGANRSLSNLASMVLMLELHGKRMLLASNSRSDEGHGSFGIDLWREVAFVDKGTISVPGA